MKTDSTEQKLIDQNRELLTPPTFKPRVRFWKHQLIGVVLLGLIPLLALLGIFGERTELKTFTIKEMQVAIKSPTLLRHGQNNSIEIGMKNNSDLEIDKVDLYFSPDYIEAFSEVEFLPGLSGPYQVTITGISPGEEKKVLVQIRADDFGRQIGNLEIRSEGNEIHSIRLDTMVYP